MDILLLKLVNFLEFKAVNNLYVFYLGCVCEDGKVLHSVHCLVAGNKCKRVSEVEKRSLFLWGNNRLCVKT